MSKSMKLSESKNLKAFIEEVFEQEDLTKSDQEKTERIEDLLHVAKELADTQKQVIDLAQCININPPTGYQSDN